MIVAARHAIQNAIAADSLGISTKHIRLTKEAQGILKNSAIEVGIALITSGIAIKVQGLVATTATELTKAAVRCATVAAINAGIAAAQRASWKKLC